MVTPYHKEAKAQFRIIKITKVIVGKKNFKSCNDFNRYLNIFSMHLKSKSVVRASQEIDVS